MEENIIKDINILNELLNNDLIHRKYKNALIEIINEANKNTCVYEQTDTDYNSWECSKCKCEWCFEEGNPKDNNTNYCPECGSRIEKIIEIEEGKG